MKPTIVIDKEYYQYSVTLTEEHIENEYTFQIGQTFHSLKPPETDRENGIEYFPYSSSGIKYKIPLSKCSSVIKRKFTSWKLEGRTYQWEEV